MTCAAGADRGRRRVAAALACTAAFALPARAGRLAAPEGRVVLTIAGAGVSRRNSPAGAEFDMEMLASLPQLSFTTRTPWYLQPRTFTGPRLRDVLAAAGAAGTTLRARALNDYAIDIPFEDARRFDVIVARLLDNEPMLVRDKGPLFIIYPFDTLPELRSAVYQSRSAWQLRWIEVR